MFKTLKTFDKTSTYALKINLFFTVQRFFCGVLILLQFLGLLSPLQAFAAPSKTTSPPRLELEVKEKKLEVELANTPQTQARGLMFRRHLGDDHGMLFPFYKKRQAIFWMKNTYLPLSIAYLNEKGKILEIYEMEPLSLKRIFSQSHKVSFALEMNQGWFALNGIKVADIIRLKNKKPLSSLLKKKNPLVRAEGIDQ